MGCIDCVATLDAHRGEHTATCITSDVVRDEQHPYRCSGCHAAHRTTIRYQVEQLLAAGPDAWVVRDVGHPEEALVVSNRDSLLLVWDSEDAARGWIEREAELDRQLASRTSTGEKPR